MNGEGEGELSSGEGTKGQMEKVEDDTMWIDGGQEEKMMGKGRRREEGKGKGAGKYRGSRGWRRLVQEVGRIVPLGDKIMEWI